MRYSDLRCHNHPEREAVARCVDCKHFFCMECITEYKGKMLCPECLSKSRTKKELNKKKSPVLDIFKTLIIFFMVWILIHWSSTQFLEINKKLNKYKHHFSLNGK